jgi:transcriptional regulator with XRE-family HTH domain
MRSKVAKRILDKTPKEVEIFARMYGDLVVRINRLLKEKGYTQKDLAEKLEKKPSEISKWLNGNHNFTIRSLAKLEAELGETILDVPKKRTFKTSGGIKTSFTVYSNVHSKPRIDYNKFQDKKVKTSNDFSRNVS